MTVMPVPVMARDQRVVPLLTALVHLVGWVVLSCIIVFIGLKYRETFRPQIRLPRTPIELRSRRQRRVRSTRAPNPSPARPGMSSGPVPLSLVSSALSDEIQNQLRVSAEDLLPEQSRYILRWPIARRRISIGAVEEGRIAQRRRASQALEV
jgi:hypothetical protein